MGETALAPVDYIVLAICTIALLRGLVRGLLRETFSIASLAVAVVAVKLLSADVADWIMRWTGGEVGEMTAPWLAGTLVGIAAIGVTTLGGRFLRSGAKAAGLGWADRAGGALLGTAEGFLLAGVLVWALGSVAGREHPLLADSRSLEVFRELEYAIETGEIALPEISLPDIAAGPPPEPEPL